MVYTSKFCFKNDTYFARFTENFETVPLLVYSLSKSILRQECALALCYLMHCTLDVGIRTVQLLVAEAS